MKKLKHNYLNLSTIIFISVYIMLRIVIYLSDKGKIILPSIISNNIGILSLIIITFLLITVFLRVSVKWITNFFEEVEEKIFYSKIYIWTFYILGLFIILYKLGVSLDNLTLMVGFIATGVAFAIRDILISFFSWVILLRKKPFRIGDYIKIGDDEGRVQHIGTFYVVLDKTPDIPEDYIKVPNKVFLEKSSVNYGKDHIHEYMRFQLKDFPEDNRVLIEELKTELSIVIENSEYLSVFTDIQNEKIFLMIDYLVDFKQRQKIRSEVMYKTFDIYRKYIHIPQM